MNALMKEWGVPVRGFTSMILCASAAARMPLAGKVAFANHAMHGSSRRGLHHAERGSGSGNNINDRSSCRLWARMLSHGSRRNNGDSVASALQFSSSSSGGDGGGDPAGSDELDACVKAAVAALPSRPRVAVVGGESISKLQQPGSTTGILQYMARRGRNDQALQSVRQSERQIDTAVKRSRDITAAATGCVCCLGKKSIYFESIFYIMNDTERSCIGTTCRGALSRC